MGTHRNNLGLQEITEAGPIAREPIWNMAQALYICVIVVYFGLFVVLLALWATLMYCEYVFLPLVNTEPAKVMGRQNRVMQERQTEYSWKERWGQK